MSGELNIKYSATGKTILALILGSDRTTRWNGAAMVNIASVSAANWTTGMVTLAEQQTSDSAASATYVGNFPAGITNPGEYAVEYYLSTAATPGSQAVGVQDVCWSGAATQLTHSNLTVSGTSTAADGVYYLAEYLANGTPYYKSSGGWYLWHDSTAGKWYLASTGPFQPILPLAYWYLATDSPIGTYTAVGYSNAAVASGKYSNPGTLLDLAISSATCAGRLPLNPSAVGDAMALTSDYDAAKTAAQPGDKMDLSSNLNNDAVETIQNGLATGSDVSNVLAAVQNIQNNTFIAANIPAILQVPASGQPQTITITLAISDETGAAHDIDSNANPAVVLINNAGTDRSARLSAWQHPATGKYTAAYTNSAGDAIENLYWEITATVNSKLRRYVATTQLVNTIAVDFTSSDRQALSGIAAQLGTAGSGLTALGDARLSNLDAAVSQVKTKTDKIPDEPAAVGSAMTLESAQRDAIAAALLDLGNAVDGKTLRQALRIIAAVLAGKISGAGSGTETFRGLDDQNDRVVVVADAYGNRTDVTYT
jgi:hypothetical protein